MKRLTQRIVLLFMAMSIFSLSSCDELKELLKFDFDLDGQALEIDVEPLRVGQSVVMGEEKFDKTLNAIIKENAPNADINKITAINLKAIRAEIISGADDDDDNNFQNITDLYAQISAEGLSSLTVAEAKDIPNTKATQLTIPVKGGSVNLKNYFNKNEFKYVLMANVRKATTKNLRIRITADYSFEFDISK